MSKPYTPAIASNGTLYVSGQIGLNPTNGELVSGGVITELKQIMENLLVLLKQHNAGYDDLLAVTIYLQTMEDYKAVNEEYVTYFTKRLPTRTCISVVGLPFNAKIEITATAEVK
jgi:2-iminobutanoate/2-iminopropanoate deaminase